MSRLGAIQTAVGVHVAAAFTAAGETVTLKYEPDAFESVQISEFPCARILFAEEPPERLAFKQERRRVVGQVAIGMIDSQGDDLETQRENVNARIEAIRDLIYADFTLTSTVDDVVCEAGIPFINPDDPVVYGTLDITTEEIF